MAETNSTAATTATTTARTTNVQTPVALSDKDKAMDSSANTLLKDFIQLYEQIRKDENMDKPTTLVITVGAAAQREENNQLLKVLQMLLQNEEFKTINKKTLKKNPKMFLHFDSEWNTIQRNMQKKRFEKRVESIYGLKQFRRNYSDYKYNRNEYNENKSHLVRRDYKPFISDYFGIEYADNWFDEQLNKLNIPEGRKNFLVRQINPNVDDDIHLFIPYDLVSHYFEDDTLYNRRKFAMNKKTLTEFGKTCPPVPGSTYDTLQKFIHQEKFENIYIYNAAYWDIKGVSEYNNKGSIIKVHSFLQNRYFEGMCELLNIVLNAGDSVKKYVYNTEFQNKLHFNTYTHKNAKNIKSIISPPLLKIGKLYPLNETTSFAGGKRKTRKQKKKALI